uniref:Uncharacterized protein n=1 Tax=Octopus bimaculoides TaxID=37653 RepID=A0A0L8H3Q6_OCTBM
MGFVQCSRFHLHRTTKYHTWVVSKPSHSSSLSVSDRFSSITSSLSLRLSADIASVLPVMDVPSLPSPTLEHVLMFVRCELNTFDVRSFMLREFMLLTTLRLCGTLLDVLGFSVGSCLVWWDGKFSVLLLFIGTESKVVF